MTQCPHAEACQDLPNGLQSCGCQLVVSLRDVSDVRLSSAVCAQCRSQWPSGQPPRQLTPVLQELFPRRGLGDVLADWIRWSRLPALLQRLGWYDPKACGCKARQRQANELTPLALRLASARCRLHP